MKRKLRKDIISPESYPIQPLPSSSLTQISLNIKLNEVLYYQEAVKINFQENAVLSEGS